MSAGSGKIARLVSLGTLGTAALILCSAAVYNGFPLVWYDTSSHLANALKNEQSWARTISYSWFLATFHQQLSLWPPIVAQAAIATYVLHVAMRVALGVAHSLTFLAVIALLALASSLPWFTGQLMPDVFTGVAVLGLYALGFGRECLPVAERLTLLGLTSLALAMHLSHVPIGFLLLVAVPIVAWLTGTQVRWRSLATASGALLVAASVIVTLNLRYTGMASLAPYGPVFLLARLVEQGPAVTYLREHCGTERFRLCAYVDELPMDLGIFLWGGPAESPFWRLGGVWALRDEATAIVAGTLRAQPRASLRTFVDGAFDQLGRVDTGWEYGPYRDHPGAPGASVPSEIRTFFPALSDAYASARQQRGTLGIDALRRLHRRVFSASIALNVLFLAWAAWRGAQRRAGPATRPPADHSFHRGLAALVLFVGVAVLANAAIAGGLGQPVHRYGSRVAWLVVFSALLGVVALVQPGRLARPACSRCPDHQHRRTQVEAGRLPL